VIIERKYGNSRGGGYGDGGNLEDEVKVKQS
jgi:hypothetical protein